MTVPDEYRRLLRLGGLAVWAAVGVPVVGFAAFGERGADGPGHLRGNPLHRLCHAPSPFSLNMLL